MGLSNFFLLGWKYFGIVSFAELQTLITKGVGLLIIFYESIG